MTQDAGNTNITTPIDYAALMAKAAQQAMDKEKMNNRFISFKSNVLSYNGNTVPGNKITVVIAAAAFENAWYPRRFDAKKLVSPDCYAIAIEEDDLAPIADEVGDQQSTSCATCELNEWESDPAGGKGKACKNQRRLAMILPANLADTTSAEVMYARIPVTSVANWAKYVTQIGNVVKRPAWGVLTELSVVPDAKTQFKVNFQFMGLVEDQYLEGMHALFDRCQKDILFGYPKNPDENEAAAPAKSAPAKGKPAAGAKF